MDATTAYRTCNGRADYENRIKKLNSGCELERSCMDSFLACHMSLCMQTYSELG